MEYHTHRQQNLRIRTKIRENSHFIMVSYQLYVKNNNEHRYCLTRPGDMFCFTDFSDGGYYNNCHLNCVRKLSSFPEYA